MNTSTVITVTGQFRNTNGDYLPIEIIDDIKYFYLESLKANGRDFNYWVTHTNRNKHLYIY